MTMMRVVVDMGSPLSALYREAKPVPRSVG